MRLKIFKNTFICIVSLMLIVLVVSNSLNAATIQGAMGPNSNGRVDIIQVVGLLARIKGIDDIFNFGLWSGTGDLSQNDDICIGVNNGGLYQILATGDGDTIDPNAFALANGAHRINYNVYFNDNTGTAGQQQLTAGTLLTGLFASSPNATRNLTGNGCGPPRRNANFMVEIPESELQQGQAGNYFGILTLVLIPQ
jgi:hypothetical protein